MRQNRLICLLFSHLSTRGTRYTTRMNTLLSSAALGVVWLTLLFGSCFLCVHIIKLARLGRQYQKQQQTPKKTEQPEKIAPPPKEGEPVYYIVEKKRRNKTSYGEPKRIQFK